MEEIMETRYLPLQEVTTRSSEDGSPILEGFFVRYGDVYEIAPGATESIAPGAFAESIHGDVRALYNHNTDIVLGRTGAGTLMLEDRTEGLWGRITVNPKDSQAMDAYQRIARADVSGCSFGFEIEKESTEIKDDGSVHWTIEKVNPLYEVSACAFPAYQATSIHARERDLEEIKQRQREAWREKMKARLNHGNSGTQTEENN